MHRTSRPASPRRPRASKTLRLAARAFSRRQGTMANQGPLRCTYFVRSPSLAHRRIPFIRMSVLWHVAPAARATRHPCRHHPQIQQPRHMSNHGSDHGHRAMLTRPPFHLNARTSYIYTHPVTMSGACISPHCMYLFPLANLGVAPQSFPRITKNSCFMSVRSFQRKLCCIVRREPLRDRYIAFRRVVIYGDSRVFYRWTLRTVIANW